MAEVFISYGRKDADLVAPIKARLDELGVDTWIDRDIPTGERYRQVIRSKLKDAKAVIVCWSPEAVESNWVDFEAQVALEVGTYVPVFLVQCVLVPDFRTSQTVDLSKWDGAPNDPGWLAVMDRIATLIDREGVAAAARAIASGDERIIYEFARLFPEESFARKVWRVAEGRHREEFSERMGAARNAVLVRTNAQRVSLDARLTESQRAFEAWLAEERRGQAKSARPDPIGLMDRQDGVDDHALLNEVVLLNESLAEAKAREDELSTESQRLSAEVATISAALAEAKAHEDDLKVANAEFTRVSERLSEVSRESQRLRDENTRLSTALMQAEALHLELNAAKTQIERFSEQLSSVSRQSQSLSDEKAALSTSLAQARQKLQSRQAAWPEVVVFACNQASDLQLNKDIGQEKLNKSRKSFSIPEEEDVLGLLDYTAFGSNKDGLALCNRVLYWKNQTEKPNFLPWSQIADCKIETKGWYRVQLRKDFEINVAGANRESVIKLLKLLKYFYAMIMQ
jgi:hypothetical protein